MKPKSRLFCMILSCMLLLCGCGTKQTGPTIARTEFPEKTQRILQPLEGDTQFFDFTTDASITESVVTVRYCQDGTWQEPEALLELSDIQPGEYHLILRWVEDRVDAFIVEDGASYSNTYPLASEWLEAFNASVTASTVGFGSVTASTVGFGSVKPIVAGEEIPLWCHYGSNTEEISTQSSDYSTSDCDTGLVFAITFS